MYSRHIMHIFIDIQRGQIIGVAYFIEQYEGTDKRYKIINSLPNNGPAGLNTVISLSCKALGVPELRLCLVILSTSLRSQLMGLLKSPGFAIRRDWIILLQGIWPFTLIATVLGGAL